MRRLLLAAGFLAALAAGSGGVWAATVGPLVTVSDPVGTPFAGCTADDVAGQPGLNFPSSEVEPWVAVDPRSPGHLVGGWQQDRWSNGGARSLLAAVSFDGGAAWTPVIVPNITVCTGGNVANGGDFKRATDPWLTFAANGDVYFFSLSLDIETPPGRAGGFGKNAMLVSKSTDGGLTWGDPITLKRDEDPQFLNDKNSITADPVDSSLVYAVWDRLQVPLGTVINPENVIGLGFKGPALFARTANAGASWEPARVIYDPGGNNQTIGNQIVVLPNGTLIDFFNEILNFRNDDGGVQFDFNLSLVRSTDKGVTWSPGPAIRAAKIQSRAVFDTFGVRDPDTGRGIRTGDIIPEVAVDPNTGTLYAVWQDARFTGFTAPNSHDDVAFSMSTDGGFTWSAPVKVNQTPAKSGQAGSAFTPAIAVASDGTVGVTYYDFRNDTPGDAGVGGPLSTDAFLVRLQVAGGGVTVIDESRLTPASFDMRKAPVARGFFLGDYVGLGAAGNQFKPFFSVAGATSGTADVVSTTVSP